MKTNLQNFGLKLNSGRLEATKYEARPDASGAMGTNVQMSELELQNAAVSG